MTSQHPGGRSDELGPLPDAPEPHQQESASAPLQPEAAGDARRDPKAEAREQNRGETLGGEQPRGGLQKDPDDWVTGDQPMTEAQRSYLDTLAREAGEEIPANLTKAEASEHIDRLQKGRPS